MTNREYYISKVIENLNGLSDEEFARRFVTEGYCDTCQCEKYCKKTNGKHCLNTQIKWLNVEHTTEDDSDRQVNIFVTYWNKNY